MQPNKHRTWAEIDLGAIEHNYRVICEAAKAPCCAWSRRTATATALYRSQTVCKAWARRISRSRLCREAVELRENGIEKPIIILGYIDAADMDTVAEYGITAPVYDEETAELLSAAAVRTGRDITVHYKLDTGMTRIGFPSWEREETVRAFSSARKSRAQERGHFYALRGGRMCRRARNTPRCSMIASAAYARVWRRTALTCRCATARTAARSRATGRCTAR